MSEKRDERVWQEARLYGVAHSPWVQAVRLALHRHGLKPRLTSYPVSMRWFFRNGFVFPALRLRDGSVHRDSFDIFRSLEASGFDMGLGAWSRDRQDAIQAELEALFLRYALGRCVTGKKVEFVAAWAAMREETGVFLGTASRALGCHYFWLLINLGILDARRRGIELYDLEDITRRLADFTDRLDGGVWFTGKEPGFVDYALLGHLQCMASGLTDELLPILRRNEVLMDWLERILPLVGGPEPVFARRLLDPRYQAPTAGRGERALFWLSWALWVLAWPVSLPLIATGFATRLKNPAASGAVAGRIKRKETP